MQFWTLQCLISLVVCAYQIYVNSFDPFPYFREVFKMQRNCSNLEDYLFQQLIKRATRTRQEFNHFISTNMWVRMTLKIFTGLHS